MAIPGEGCLLSCNQCTRRYSTQSALFRHQKSHDRNQWHSCGICKLRFSRKDILRRHKQVHGDGDGPTDRKRAIRACDECRKSKTRCNSNNPCNACLEAGRRCTYLMKTSRPSIQGFRGEHEPVQPPTTSLPRSDQPTITQYESPPSLLSDTSSDTDALELVNVDNYLPATTGGALSTMSPEVSELMTDIDQLLFQPLDTSILAPTYPQIATPDLLLSEVNELGAGFTLSGDVPAPRISDFYGSTPLLKSPSMKGMLSNMGPPKDIQSPALRKAQFPISKASHDLIHDIVQQASVDFLEIPKKDAIYRSRKRRGFSQLIERSFELSDWMRNKATHVMHTFVTSFFDNFASLWPVSWRQGFDYDAVEPLLYLTMTSIGAMYAGCPTAASYGLALHHELRPVLLNSCLLCPEDEVKLEAIFEALLLTEIMSLYLGHAQASKYAQQASAVLVAHARRLNLFHELPAHRFPDLTSEVCHEQTEEKLTRWIRMERRRRMAFGFFRCEIFSSLLLNTRPLVSPEDLRLNIPCDHEQWTYVGPNWRERLLAAVQEAACYPLYCDLLHAISDGTQGKLPLLNASAHELVVYGLQQRLWDFCRNVARLHSTIDGIEDNLCLDPSLIFATFQTSTVGGDVDESSHSRILRHLGEWRALQDNFQCSTQQNRRCSPARLLYHTGYLRINVDLETLQKVASHNPEFGTQSQKRRVQKMMFWATTEAAKVSLHHACQIWYLAQESLSQNKENSPRRYDQDFNILSMISLYYAALVIWAMSELCPNLKMEAHLPGRDELNTVLTGDYIRRGVGKLGEIASKLSPSWETASSFAVNTKAPYQRELCIF